MERIRIDGWKAIAAHLRRARSTVTRWANEDGLPVHRVAGRDNASVWAYSDELEAWLTRNEAAAKVPTSARFRWPTVWIVVGGAVIAVVVATVALRGGVGRASSGAVYPSLPADHATAELYLKARDDWSLRTADSLRQAKSEFGEVTARDPGFAAAYAGLADAYILSREYDSQPSETVLAKAEAAAGLALAIDPKSAEANRAMGFVDYYRHHDLSKARRHFEASIASAPSDPQTHLWFGDLVADAGDNAAGLRELTIARSLNPGSPPIEADYDYLVWQHGPGAAAVEDLRALDAREPRFVSPRTYLALIDLVDGDLPDYLKVRRELTRIENDPILARRVAGEEAAYARGGRAGLLAYIAAMGPNDVTLSFDTWEWPATAAALTGRRDVLIAAIERARAAGHSWSPWRLDQARRAPWKDDPQVTAGLRALNALAPERPPAS